MEKISIELNDDENPTKKRKVYNTGDIIILDETRYFSYDIDEIKNDGGIFSNTFMIFNCCGKSLRRHISYKDYACIIDHLKTSHSALCIDCITEEPKQNRVKINYKIKCVL
jgi:hypothetical protein